jgi:hypothetical protein
MLTYWDTSAVLNAVVSPAVEAWLDTGKHVTRLHTITEIFAIATGRGIPVKGVFLQLTPEDCAAWLRKFAARVELADLDKTEMLDALDKAEAKQVRGKGVFDYLHALLSDRVQADELLTRDTLNFQRLAMAKVEWP